MKSKNSSKKNQDIIHYEFLGDGAETVVLVNGLARSSRHWLDFPAELVKRGYRVLLVDNRGFGRSSQLPLSYFSSVADYADDIDQVLKRENISKFHIIGLSLGGMIANSLAALDASRVQTLTIVNSSTAKSYMMRLSSGGFLKLLKMGLQKNPRRRSATELNVLLNMDENHHKWENYLDRLEEIEREEPVKVANVNAQINAAMRFNLNRIAKNITCPVLILYSDQDQFVPNRNSFAVHQRLNHGVRKCLKGHGHELMMSAPEEVASEFADFAKAKR